MTLLYQPVKTKTTITSKMTFLQQPVKKKTINIKMVFFTTASKTTINKMTFLQITFAQHHKQCTQSKQNEKTGHLNLSKLNQVRN
jgi:hypothetical protein